MTPINQALPDNFLARLAGARLFLQNARDADALDAFRDLAAEIVPINQPEIDAACYEGAAQAFRNLGELEAARRMLEQGLAKYPGNVHLRFTRALFFLGMRCFAEGWPDYELRLKIPQRAYMPRPITFPRWSGGLSARSLLVWSEQGFGDEIMFASLLPVLQKYEPDITITFECSRECAPLFRRSFPGIEIVTRSLSGGMSDELHGRAFDYEIPLASIPGALQLDEIPAPRAFLTGLGSGKPPRPCIGVSWRGGTKHTRSAARSLTLPVFLSNIDAPDTNFISLQHDATDEELKTVPRLSLGANLLHNHGAVRSLDGLAALIVQCDAIVTVCNTNVHLAGAMGKPVFVLAPHVPEWRYGLPHVPEWRYGFPGFAFNALPWYERVRIFRQSSYGDWGSALERVQKALADFLR